MTDKILTRLANRKILSVSEADMLMQNFKRLKTYQVTYDDVPKEYKATSDLDLIEFLKETEITVSIISIQEKIVTYRTVDYTF